MDSKLVGERLLDICRNAKQEVFLAAPFIKQGSLKRVLDAIPEEVERITIVTRWIPEEIASGVSDLEIFSLLQHRSIDLLLHPALHAKLYRVDGKCLLGSANITDRALGWSWHPNIELMVDTAASESNVVELERLLLLNSLKATQDIHDAMKLKVEELMTSHDEFKAFQADQLEAKWLPICLKPALLYRIYIKDDTSRELKSLIECGEQDLAKLQIPGGMTEVQFKKYICLILDQHPITIQINQLLLNASLTSEHGIQVLQSYCQADTELPYDIETHWSIIKSWLMHFFPNKYRVKVTEEVFEQARTIL